MSDWGRVLQYVVGAVEDQRRAEDLMAQAEAFAIRARTGRVMAKKIIDMKIAGGEQPGGVGAGPAARRRRAGGSRNGEAGGVA